MAEPVKRNQGLGRILVMVYAVFALSAFARSLFQILTDFSSAPLAYLLSTVAALIYLVATVAMVRGGHGGRRVALWAISIEMAGVLVVGAMSVTLPELFPDETVWSTFGKQYFYVPLVLPALGLWWLLRGADSTR